MCLLIAGITVVVIIGCIIGVAISDGRNGLDDILFPISLLAMFILGVTLLVCLILGVSVTKLTVIEDTIAMYEEENVIIEDQIALIVKQYQDYETDIFTSVSPDSAVTLIALYPELKADTLVQTQINIYLTNNQKIRELKERQINGSVMKWWLYFGK